MPECWHTIPRRPLAWYSKRYLFTVSNTQQLRRVSVVFNLDFRFVFSFQLCFVPSVNAQRDELHVCGLDYRVKQNSSCVYARCLSFFFIENMNGSWNGMIAAVFFLRFDSSLWTDGWQWCCLLNVSFFRCSCWLRSCSDRHASYLGTAPHKKNIFIWNPLSGLWKVKINLA